MSENIKEIPDSEIMEKVLAELRYSALAFANELKYKSHSTIHHILCGRNKISDDLVDRIIKRFPEVHYWFLKKGQLPVLLNDKLTRNQANLLGVKIGVDNIDYSTETFIVLKNIENILLRIETSLNKKSDH